MKLALFDFDETLTQRNSLWCLYRMALNERPGLMAKMISRSIVSPWTQTKLERDVEWKSYSKFDHIKRVFRQQLYLSLVDSFSKEDLYNLGCDIAPTLRLNQFVVDRLITLNAEGHCIWVVTGSLEPFVEGVIDQLKWPVDRVVGTSWEPEIIGTPGFKECLRHEKVKRIQSIVDCEPKKVVSAVAYGNLPDDGPMLSLAEKSFSVSNGKPNLLTH